MGKLISLNYHEAGERMPDLWASWFLSGPKERLETTNDKDSSADLDLIQAERTGANSTLRMQRVGPDWPGRKSECIASLSEKIQLGDNQFPRPIHALSVSWKVTPLLMIVKT